MNNGYFMVNILADGKPMSQRIDVPSQSREREAIEAVLNMYPNSRTTGGTKYYSYDDERAQQNRNINSNAQAQPVQINTVSEAKYNALQKELKKSQKKIQEQDAQIAETLRIQKQILLEQRLSKLTPSQLYQLDEINSDISALITEKTKVENKINETNNTISRHIIIVFGSVFVLYYYITQYIKLPNLNLFYDSWYDLVLIIPLVGIPIMLTYVVLYIKSFFNTLHITQRIVNILYWFVIIYTILFYTNMTDNKLFDIN